MEVSIAELQLKLKALNLTIISDDDLAKLQKDFYLHDYSSYEEYRETQIRYNKQKIDQVWADPITLTKVAEIVGVDKKSDLSGICHGSRNGFEVEFFKEKLNVKCLGTDISETASNFPDMIQWDFHDENTEWVGKFDFVYTNSLDQSWNPKNAVSTWLRQLNTTGVLVIEHTHDHGPLEAGAMDPFGCKPEYMPYLFADWFGHSVSLSIQEVERKENYDLKVWLFCLRRIGVLPKN